MGLRIEWQGTACRITRHGQLPLQKNLNYLPSNSLLVGTALTRGLFLKEPSLKLFVTL